MVTSDFRPEVEIQPFRACAIHPAIIIQTVRLLGRSYGANTCLLYTSPSPRDGLLSRMPSSA